jgi:hypothetical protein
MQIESTGMTRDELYSTPEEKSGYAQGAFFASMNESLSSLITKLGLSENDFRSKVSRLNKWLDIDRNMQADVNNIIIIFPIYCRKVNGILNATII